MGDPVAFITRKQRQSGQQQDMNVADVKMTAEVGKLIAFSRRSAGVYARTIEKDVMLFELDPETRVYPFIYLSGSAESVEIKQFTLGHQQRGTLCMSCYDQKAAYHSYTCAHVLLCDDCLRLGLLSESLSIDCPLCRYLIRHFEPMNKSKTAADKQPKSFDSGLGSIQVHAPLDQQRMRQLMSRQLK